MVKVLPFVDARFILSRKIDQRGVMIGMIARIAFFFLYRGLGGRAEALQAPAVRCNNNCGSTQLCCFVS